MIRRVSKQVSAGKVKIGGDAPITVQSMISEHWWDTKKNVEQAKRLEKAGCEILRVAVPKLEAAGLIHAIKSEISIPLVADIHFDYKIALEAVRAGADKIRMNPGNITDKEGIGEVARLCREKKIPIRIGVNSGSIERKLLEKFGGPTAQAMCESACQHMEILKQHDFEDIVISLKASNIDTMIEAYKQMGEMCSYPLHLGLTETGTFHMGTIKSAVGIGALLQQGIGDTIRVSLTEDPVQEVAVGIDILRAVGIRGGINFISCPTCGRTEIDLIALAHNTQEMLKDCDKNITVAVMGCAVNGPGEAREADLGIAGGKGEGLLFRKGKIIKKVPEQELLQELLREIEEL